MTSAREVQERVRHFDPELVGEVLDRLIDESRTTPRDGCGRGAFVALEMLGVGNYLRAGLGEEGVERRELRAVEDPGRLRDALDPRSSWAVHGRDH